jgi:PPOX class probable F420-dependent enzyme
MTIEIPASHADLLQIPVATLATVGPTGYPQVSAVWFIWEDGVVKTSLVPERQKYINGVRTGKATWSFIDPANPYKTLEIRGDVSVADDTDLTFLSHLLTKYGQTLETFQAPKENRKVFTVTPVRVRVWGK